MNMKHRLREKRKNDSENQLISDRGFTLIEMLIVTAILSVVALAIYATLNNGIKIWQKVNRQLPEEDLNIFFDKFTLDIRNTFKFTGINFSGTIEKVEFPTLVNPVRDYGESGKRYDVSNGVNSPGLQKRTIGKVIYFYDDESKIISREQKDFSQVYSDEKGAIRESLRNVRALKFQYYLYDEQKKECLWQDEWSKEGLPLAVKMELEFDDGAEIKKFTKTVAIPTSG